MKIFYKRCAVTAITTSLLGTLLYTSFAFSTSPNDTNTATQSSKEIIFNRDYSAIPATAKNDPSISQYFANNKLCDKPVVVEFFSYGCGGCYGAETNFQNWLKTKSANVQFKRIPVDFHPGWDLLAKVYYTNEALSIEDTLHTRIFEWFIKEVNHSQPLSAEMIKGFIQNELKSNASIANKFSVDEYMNIFNSTGLQPKINEGMRMFTSYGLLSSPSVAINNQYTVTVAQAKTLDNLIEIINALAKDKTNCSAIARS